MMKKTASALVAKMQSWVGLKKADGSYQVILDIYNAHKPLPRGHKMVKTDAWCAATVSAAAIACGMTDIIPPECSCNQMIALFKSLGEWQENENVTPAPGWVIFYDWDDSGSGDNTGKADHVGVVEKVSNGVITVIEGNYSGAVKRREVKVNGKYIRGYGVPKFDKEIVIRDDLITKHPLITKYEVVKGDTPERIAKKFVLTPQELIAANIGKYPRMTIDYIQIGWVLDIPAKKVEAIPVWNVKVTTQSGLNVRTGPGTSYPKIGALYYGETVRVLGVSDDDEWGLINFKTKDGTKPGWICLAYTKEV